MKKKHSRAHQQATAKLKLQSRRKPQPAPKTKAPRASQQSNGRGRAKPSAATTDAATTVAKPAVRPPNASGVGRKIPEALPLKSEQAKIGALSRLTTRVFKKPAIQEVVREPTSGGIVYRMSKDQKDIEILLIQDSKGRWTIPKGHIEPGENAKQTAVREIGEESGLFHIQVMAWLGKIHFQYRRVDKLVLMTTQIYLVRALDEAEIPTKEQWMKGIKWFKFNDALDAIEYEDIEKLMLLAKNKIRQGL